MGKILACVCLGLAVYGGTFSVAAAAPAACTDCDTRTPLTIREQIKASRALEVDRIAKESSARPWDGKDLVQAKRTIITPVIR